MIKSKIDVSCIWGGTLAGILLKNGAVAANGLGQPTTKIIGIHGWLDNLNSLLPIAEKLVNRPPSTCLLKVNKA